MNSKLLLFAYLFFLGGVLTAQNSFPNENAMWQIRIYGIAAFDFNYAICGDTIINGNLYAKFERWSLDSNLNIIGKLHEASIRSNGSQVFVVPDYDEEEVLLYDFSLEEGDTIELVRLYYLTNPVIRTVDSVRFENLAGKQRKVIYFKPLSANGVVEYWIEGIGSNFGVLLRAIPPSGSAGSELRCFREGGDYINFTPFDCVLPEVMDCEIVDVQEGREISPISIFPNPASDEILVSHVDGNLTSLEISLYHLEGRLIKRFSSLSENEINLDISDLNSGIYFLKIEDEKTGRILKVEKVIISK